MTIKARVQGGQLVVSEPIDLPDGTELELLALDSPDSLSDEDILQINRALEESEEDIAAGRLVDAADVLKRLRES